MEHKEIPNDWQTVYDTHFMYQIRDLYNPAKQGEWISVCPSGGACGYRKLDEDGVIDSVNFRGYSNRYLVYSDDSIRANIVGHYRKCADPACGHAITQAQADYANAFLHNIEPEKITMEDVDRWMEDLFS